MAVGNSQENAADTADGDTALMGDDADDNNTTMQVEEDCTVAIEPPSGFDIASAVRGFFEG